MALLLDGKTIIELRHSLSVNGEAGPQPRFEFLDFWEILVQISLSESSPFLTVVSLLSGT